MAEKDKRYYARHRDKVRLKNAERNRIKRSKRNTDESHERGESDNSVSTLQIVNPPTTRIDAGVQATPEDTEEDIILHGIFFAEKTSVHVLETTLDESNSFKSHPALLELPADFTTLSTTYKQYDLFLDIRDLVNSWSSIWGGIENWEQALNVLFKRAITNGSRPARELVRQVYRWCEKGQNILNNLDEIQGRLPSDPMAYHLLWKYHNQQVKLLVKGITILECRMKSINFSLLSPGELDYHSALRNLFQTSDANTSLLN